MLFNSNINLLKRGIDFQDKSINVITSSYDSMICLTQDNKFMFGE